MVVLEKFTRCSMNPDVPGYIAKKVGTSDGEYELNSKYIMLNMSSNHPTDAYPSGFKGFVNNSNFGGSTIGSVMYKTEYYIAGDVTGYNSDGSPITTSGDTIRKVCLGFSTQSGYDDDLLKYKGKAATDTTKGFHLSTNASTITGTTYLTTPYDLEGQTGADNFLTNINNRKFTLALCGGFDGWDIYRNVRTYGDSYIFGKKTYVSGNTANGGVFSTVSTSPNSDYYSYIKGIDTFGNPEAVDINIFATPGINFYDHSSLTSYAIDMVEQDRADSLYVIGSPNYSTVDEVVGALDGVAMDTNYSATYFPWIQIRDVDNATQLYIPPTGEVVRNIALTDNVSFPWFAVAGYSRGLVNSIKAVKKLTLDERDELYKNRINPIATFSDTGTIIWGNKTLQVRESALDRINVRRLLLRARKLISAVAVRLIFEQNDEQVRNEFLRLVNPILDAIKRERGLFDFRVTVSSDPADIDANTLRGKIFIKPTRSLEFIDVEFIITPTGASFDNI
jgi:phage tail sheath protein FI